MKYYEGHEETYRRLQKEGHTCWDKRPFDEFYMKPFLIEALRRIGTQSDHARVLELGCGTGPGACFLTKRGFRVTAIDISETAIQSARAIAEKEDLKIEFRVGDICCLPQTEKFDVIVDSHALHCLVTDNDRQATYSGIQGVLSDDGYFISETMVFSPAMKFSEHFRYEANGILWVLAREDHPFGATQIDGKWYLPNRRILSEEALKTEMRDAGFQVQWSNVVEQSSSNAPSLLQTICTPVLAK